MFQNDELAGFDIYAVEMNCPPELIQSMIAEARANTGRLQCCNAKRQVESGPVEAILVVD